MHRAASQMTPPLTLKPARQLWSGEAAIEKKRSSIVVIANWIKSFKVSTLTDEFCCSLGWKEKNDRLFRAYPELTKCPSAFMASFCCHCCCLFVLNKNTFVWAVVWTGVCSGLVWAGLSTGLSHNACLCTLSFLFFIKECPLWIQ